MKPTYFEGLNVCHIGEPNVGRRSFRTLCGRSAWEYDRRKNIFGEVCLTCQQKFSELKCWLEQVEADVQAQKGKQP